MNSVNRNTLRFVSSLLCADHKTGHRWCNKYVSSIKELYTMQYTSFYCTNMSKYDIIIYGLHQIKIKLKKEGWNGDLDFLCKTMQEMTNIIER